MHIGFLVMLFGVHLPLVGGGGDIIELFHYGLIFFFLIMCPLWPSQLVLEQH